MSGGGPARLTGPLLLLAFAGVGVGGVNAVFSNSVRWVILAAAAVVLLPYGFPRSLYRTRFMVASLAYAGWAGFSILWSEVPKLSAAKSLALFIVMTAGTTAGYAWVRYSPLDKSLDLLLPLLALAVWASLRGGGGASSVSMGEGVTLYQGATGNPNYLGALCAMALPLPAWKWLSTRQGGWRNAWLALAGVLVLVILLSRSRAAMLILTSIGIGAWGVMGQRNRRLAELPVALLAALVLLFAPSIREQLTEDLFFKGNREAGILASRQETWGDSWDAAVQGGLWGLGYGVSAGADVNSAGLATAVGYGREKGNAQLGIVEELGIVGLGLYLVSTIALLMTARTGARRNWRSANSMALRLVGFTLLGMTLHSIFEAWYNSPGSMECVYYWVLAGVAIGLATDPRLQSPIPGAEPIGPGPALRETGA